MSGAVAPAGNPLARLAEAVPGEIARAVSVGGRLVGAALAVYVVFDQSYDRTEVFAGAVAVLVAASVLVRAGLVGALAAGFGAGLLFFSGAVLFSQAAGVGMLVAGCVAGAAAMVEWQRAGRGPWEVAVGFFGSLGVLTGMLVVIALVVEG